MQEPLHLVFFIMAVLDVVTTTQHVESTCVRTCANEYQQCAQQAWGVFEVYARNVMRCVKVERRCRTACKRTRNETDDTEDRRQTSIADTEGRRRTSIDDLFDNLEEVIEKYLDGYGESEK